MFVMADVDGKDAAVQVWREAIDRAIEYVHEYFKHDQSNVSLLIYKVR